MTRCPSSLRLGADFDGETYDRALDKLRLTGQLRRVFLAMSDGQWRTLKDLSGITGCSEASVSARLRDLRKDKFGGFEVHRRRERGGLFKYRLIVGQKDLFE